MLRCEVSFRMMDSKKERAQNTLNSFNYSMPIWNLSKLAGQRVWGN
jgi:hypothetical protein